ncbi:MAG: HAMP domain-containing protein [Xanthomonadales bacterium]|nr:HAMP domain-containing protein [Xanthomonadales bacterium]
MKRSGTSLRRRVSLAYGLLGALLSLMFAGATILITEHYEQVLLDGILGDVAGDLQSRHKALPEQALSLPHTHMLRGYLRDDDGKGTVPAILADLPPGIHEPELGEDLSLRVSVFDLGRERVYLVINLADIENLETHLDQILAVIVIAGTLIAAWLGWLFAGRTIAPVRRLAEAVEALPDHAEATQLSLLTANDELGRLAAAIDGYQARLIDAESRERSFFADASHELRTPLAVVLGTTELLLDDGRSDDILQRRLQRLDRGAQTLADLLEVLLGLARGKLGAAARIETQSWLRQILADFDKGDSLRLHIDADAESLQLLPREAALVIRDIVRRLLRSSSENGLEITVGCGEILFRCTADVSSESAPHAIDASGDRSLGATLSGRLATRMAWTVDEGQLESGTVRIRLPPAPA